MKKLQIPIEDSLMTELKVLAVRKNTTMKVLVVTQLMKLINQEKE
jgi:hypothetical protein